MRRLIAATLLIIFTTFNVVVIYSMYSKGINTSISMTEEEETHKENFKLIKYSRSKLHLLDQVDKSPLCSTYLIKHYKDVCIDVIVPPPNIA